MTTPKITFVGAGSTVFARALIRDLYTFPELQDARLTLMDIDEGRLRYWALVDDLIAAHGDLLPLPE